MWRHEKLLDIVWTGTARAATSRSRTSFGTRNSSAHSSIFTSISVGPVLDPTYLLPPNRCLHCTKVWHLSDMWLSTFEISAAQLHSVTEIAPLEPLLCVTRSPIRYDFRGDTKAIRYIVSIASHWASKKEEFNKYAVLLYFCIFNEMYMYLLIRTRCWSAILQLSETGSALLKYG